MREIIFRGKRIDNGEWEYGHYAVLKEGHTIINSDGNGLFFFNLVDPETVGQFTGLIDKNGKEVYEGDIIHYRYLPGEGLFNIEQNGIIRWEKVGWYFEGLDDDGTRGGWQVWLTGMPGMGILNEPNELIEVIGNVHENPEFLREKS